MSRKTVTGAEQLCATLEALGTTHVFGLPGTQNVLLYDALRRSRIRSILPTSELAASFMANGYYRASGRIAPLVTIQGPGFTYALTGLAEARDDSVALLHLVGKPPAGASTFAFQALDQEAIASPIVKAVRSVDRAEDVAAAVEDAHALALAGEPGPVMLQLAGEAMAEPCDSGKPAPRSPPADLAPPELQEAAHLLQASRRPLLLVGQGCAASARGVRALAEALRAPVLTSTSGRGIVPEDHPLALGLDFARSSAGAVNPIFEACDCILVLGCRLGAGLSEGLVLSEGRLIHVDASREVLGARHRARCAVHARVEDALPVLLQAALRRSDPGGEGWSSDSLAGWKARLAKDTSGAFPEPVVSGIDGRTPAALFGALRRALPRDAILVTDSGLHQVLARRHFPVLSPRGLMVPSDFQSMGFAIPAALGAKLAAPERTVVAVVGDGGMAMSGLELLTSVRERIPVVVLVLADGQLNRIRLQQFGEFGRASSVRLVNPSFEDLASAIGARYALLGRDAEPAFKDAIRAEETTLIEVELGDSAAIRRLRGRGFVRQAARKGLGPAALTRLKRLLRRTR